MPWVPSTSPLLDLNPPVQDDTLREAPSLGQVIGAAWRQSNIIGSTIASAVTGIDNTPDPSFNAFDAAKEAGPQYYEAHEAELAHMPNRANFEAFKAQIDRESMDRRTLASSGWTGIFTSAAVGMIDPTILFPAGALMRAGKVGYDVVRTAGSVGVAAAGQAAAQEALLHATQETRPLGESAMAVGGSAMLGALLGAAGAKLLSNAEWHALSDRLAADVDKTGPLPIDRNHDEMLTLLPQPGGADVPAKPTLDQLSVAGKAASTVVNKTAQLNPLLRALTSPSARQREIMLGLMENPIYLKGNLEGRASEAAVETLMKEYTHGAVADAVENTNSLYKQMRKGGGEAISAAEFRNRIGIAMRNNDVDAAGNDFVSQAAQLWRAKVFNPLKEKGIEAGLLSEGVRTDTAPSYFHRMYNRPLIEANEAEFKSVVKDWVRETMRAQAHGMSKEEAESYIQEIADSVFNKVTGREAPGAGENPFRIVAATRGPLKERTFNIPDAKIAKYLESDVELVGRRYARVMAADTELARKYGRADLEDQIAQVRAEYQTLRAEAKSEKAVRRLNAREKADIRDMRAVRDMLRGQYLPEQNGSDWSKIMAGASAFNYMRAMGGVVAASITDVARPMMVHGLMPFMRDGIAPLLKNLRAVKMSAAEAKLAGSVTERVLQNRLATMAEIVDPYGVGSPFERFLNNAAAGFTKATGMPIWNDAMKSIAAVMTQTRVLRNAETDWGALSASERSYMAFLGINEGMASRIQRQFVAHGETLDGMRVAHTEDWTDDVARRAYRAALNKDNASTIVEKGVGDVPLFMRTPTGRAMLQFRGFALASHQKVLIRGLQESKANAIAGLAASTALGAMIFYFKAIENNRDTDFFDNPNPGRLIAEGLDRSGIFAIPFEINNTLEKIGAQGVYHSLERMFPDAAQGKAASRYASRSVVDAWMGPTFGLANDAVGLLSAAFARNKQGDWEPDLTPQDIDRMRRLMPGATLPLIRSLLEYSVIPEAKEAVK